MYSMYRVYLLFQLSIGVSVLCIPWLRFTQPDLKRPIKVNMFFPVVYIAATLFVTIIPIIASPVETGRLKYGLQIDIMYYKISKNQNLNKYILSTDKLDE